MSIKHIHTYLVYPNKGAAQPLPVVGNEVLHEGDMFDLLQGIYDNAEKECSIDIAFTKAKDGSQNNDCRDLLTSYIAQSTIDVGRRMAERLAQVTTKRSGLGLMFLICGMEGFKHKAVLSRFRANTGVLVNEAPDELTVEFIDRVFMKNAHSYKAVVYKDHSLKAGFWSGLAVDKQINSRDVETSDYWVKDFLASQFLTSAALGTRRLALALKDASRTAGDLTTKQQITAAVTLAPSLGGKTVSVNDFCDRYGFSNEAKQALIKALGRADLASDKFRFDASEFRKQLPYRTVELNTGAMLTAHSGNFDEIFEKEEIDAVGKTYRFSTTGEVISEKLDKKR